MRWNMFKNIGSLGAIVVFLFSMSMVSFAHDSIELERNDPAILAYLAMGGTLNDLCGPLGDGPAGHAGECEACLISGGFNLADTQTQWRFYSTTFVTMEQISTDVAHRSAPFDPARASRAPPLFG